MSSNLAWCYLRWSKAEQGARSGEAETERDSETRQLRDVQAWCRRHGLETDPSRIVVDRGRSGYAGVHLARGELGRFIQRVERGEIPRGSCLVVEEFDRLSRLPASQARKVIGLFTERDIRVGVVSSDQILDAKSQDNLISDVGMTLRIHLASEESAKKKTRSLSAWAAKRALVAAGGKLTSSLPGWLLIDAKGDWQFSDRAAGGLKAVELYLSGIGTHRVAGYLNANCYSTMRGTGRWSGSTVREFLMNEALHGEYTPHHSERVLTHVEVEDDLSEPDADGRKRKLTRYRSTLQRAQAAETIPDYYKPLIDRATYDRVQAKLRAGFKGGGGRGEISNVFQGVMRCAECDGPIQQVEKRGHRYLFCYKARRLVAECTARGGGLKLEKVARPILERAALAFDFVARGASPEQAAIDAEIAEKGAERDRLQRRLDGLMLADDDGVLIDQIKRLAIRVKELDTEVSAAQRRLIASQTRQTARPVAYDAAIETFLGPASPERSKATRLLNNALKEVIEPFAVHINGPRAGWWEMETVGGWATTASDWAGWHTEHEARGKLDAGEASGIVVVDLDDPATPLLDRDATAQLEHEIRTRELGGREVAARIDARQKTSGRRPQA